MSQFGIRITGVERELSQLAAYLTTSAAADCHQSAAAGLIKDAASWDNSRSVSVIRFSNQDTTKISCLSCVSWLTFRRVCHFQKPCAPSFIVASTVCASESCPSGRRGQAFSAARMEARWPKAPAVPGWQAHDRACRPGKAQASCRFFAATAVSPAAVASCSAFSAVVTASGKRPASA